MSMLWIEPHPLSVTYKDMSNIKINHSAVGTLKAHALHFNMGIFRTVALCTGAFQVPQFDDRWMLTE